VLLPYKKTEESRTQNFFRVLTGRPHPLIPTDRYGLLWPPWHAAACTRLSRPCQTVDTLATDQLASITAMLFSLPTGLAGDLAVT
jgi:hypothetical protein